ncbi:MAG: esterase family protein [Lachnospiraceae bacterium]|nr:esterase family protein [Lachnospiraceae bacterium]
MSENTENKELNVEETVEDNSTIESTGEIVEKCPISASEKKSGVAYGEYGHDTYFSKTCNMERAYSFLLPANYDENKKYPVMYLLHGIFGDENSFPSDSNNKIKEIFGNLSSEGRTREWIVIMPNMFAKDKPEQAPGFSAEGVWPYDNFINDLVNDLMPTVEERYSVLTGRDNTAIAGFSMGGRETLYISVSRPDLFSFACAIAPAPGVVPGKDNFMVHEGTISEEAFVYPKEGDENELKLLIVCAGDHDSVVGKFPLSYHTILEGNGSKHIWFEVPGADHDNTAIKSGIYNFLIQIEECSK